MAIEADGMTTKVVGAVGQVRRMQNVCHRVYVRALQLVACMSGVDVWRAIARLTVWSLVGLAYQRQVCL